MNLLDQLAARKLIHPPSWLPDNVHYLAMRMRSVCALERHVKILLC